MTAKVMEERRAAEAAIQAKADSLLAALDSTDPSAQQACVASLDALPLPFVIALPQSRWMRSLLLSSRGLLGRLAESLAFPSPVHPPHTHMPPPHEPHPPVPVPTPALP